MRDIALLFACLLATAGSTAESSSFKDLIGRWEEDPGTCEGDNFVAYRRDGKLFGYDYEGRWSVQGTALSTTITKRMGADEKWRPVRHPRREVSTIVFITPRVMVERWADGSLHRLHRCRGNGS